MDPVHAILAFALAAGLLTVTPGLDTALVLRTAAVEGPRRGMQVAFGVGLMPRLGHRGGGGIGGAAGGVTIGV